MNLSGKTALVTGGTAGIGEQIALQLKAKGSTVIVTGRSPAGLARARAAGFEAISADLSLPRGAQALVEALQGRAIDLLVNNAGQGVDHDFRQGAPDMGAADDCIHANLNAPIRLVAGLLDGLKARPEAAIVNVTSGLAIAPNTGSAVYCATKAGLRSYTMSLRAQLAGTNIHVIEALPPVVETQMTARLDGKKLSPQECARQIVEAIEHDRAEANVGQVKLLRRIYSLSPAFARRFMLKY